MTRYTTLAELQAACRKARAERAEELPYLVIDNDRAYADQDGDCVFRMDLLGIPHEGA